MSMVSVNEQRAGLFCKSRCRRSGEHVGTQSSSFQDSDTMSRDDSASEDGYLATHEWFVEEVRVILTASAWTSMEASEGASDDGERRGAEAEEAVSESSGTQFSGV